MRAARVLAHGPPESVVIEELADLEPGSGHIVVDVAYAAVNFPDVLIVANEYQVSIPPPFIPGSEFSGVVSTVGEGVTSVSVGDHVYGASFVGAYAQQIRVSEHSVTVVPDTIDLREAAAFSVAHTTAMHALRTIADLQPGESVLVLGAAGGVGLAAVELATLLGGRVVAAASTDAKLELCRKYGAVAGINYSSEDLKVRAKELTGGAADVVIDPVGGPYSEQALRATGLGSRYVVLGFAAGEIPRIPLNVVLLKGVIVRGMEMRTITENVPELVARDLRELRDLFLTGQVHPYVSAVYPLADTALALQSMLDRTATGKVLIDPSA
jgi:NADPH2:quinone reductase